MSEYKMNLNGISAGDMMQCVNGDRYLITSFSRGIDRDIWYATAQLVRNGEPGAFKSHTAKINHSEKDNNCWKFYRQTP